MMKSSSSLTAGRIPTLNKESEWFIEQVRLSGRSERTLEAFGHALRRFGRFLEEHGISDVRSISGDILDAYSAAVRERVSRESAHLYLRVVKLFFRFLAESHRLLVDPASGMALPKLHRRQVGDLLTEEAMDRLMASPDVSTIVGIRDRAMLEFLYSTALRVTELRSMRVEDIDLEDGTARVVEGKGAQDRMVPIGREALGWLRRYLTESRLRASKNVPELFVSRWGRPFSAQVIARHLRGLGRRAGLKINLTCHVIRRTVATRLLARGASPQEAAALLGHRDIRSLGRYVAFASRELREAHARTHPREGDDA